MRTSIIQKPGYARAEHFALQEGGVVSESNLGSLFGAWYVLLLVFFFFFQSNDIPVHEDVNCSDLLQPGVRQSFSSLNPECTIGSRSQ